MSNEIRSGKDHRHTHSGSTTELPSYCWYLIICQNDNSISQIIKPQQCCEYWHVEHKPCTVPDVDLHVLIVVTQRITFQIQHLDAVSYQRIQLVPISQLHNNKNTLL